MAAKHTPKRDRRTTDICVSFPGAIVARLDPSNSDLTTLLTKFRKRRDLLNRDIKPQLDPGTTRLDKNDPIRVAPQLFPVVATTRRRAYSG